MKQPRHDIALLTSWGGQFGTGHLQRISSLQRALRAKGYNPILVCSPSPSHIIEEDELAATVPPGVQSIIRDMRDSSVEEIRSLQQIAPVLAIDDCGEGRNAVDQALDLLPNLLQKPEGSEPSFEQSPFLFGVTFTRKIEEYGDRDFEKNIDLCIYTGLNPSKEYFEFLQSLIPDEWTAVIVDGKSSRLFINGAASGEGAAYPEALLRSKRLLTHFGVTLYEGDLCGCALAAINPTRYHNALCEKAKQTLLLWNFGIYPETDSDIIKKGLKEITPSSQRINTAMIGRRIEAHTTRCTELIVQFIKNNQ
jgi:hypothetical protein